MTATTTQHPPTSHTLAQRLEFAPPTTRGGLPSALLALLVHLALVGALALSVQWKQQVESPVVDAELWSAVPTLAAAKAQEPPEPEQPIQPPPEPITPKQLAPSQPLPLPPAPIAEVKDAQIALEREKKREKRKAEALALEQQAERIAEQKRLDKIKKRDEEKQVQAKEEALEKEKLAKAKLAEKTKKREADQRLADEHEAQILKAEKAEKADKASKANQAAKAAVAKAEEVAGREKQMQRIMGMAGASGDANATGTTQKSSGPSANYAGRIAAKIKSNIVFPDDIAGNPAAEVEVRTAPDGSVVGTPRVTKSSGVKAWDDAVVNAILKTETLPRDVDGRIPPVISMRFKPKD